MRATRGYRCCGAPATSRRGMSDDAVWRGDPGHCAGPRGRPRPVARGRGGMARDRRHGGRGCRGAPPRRVGVGQGGTARRAGRGRHGADRSDDAALSQDRGRPRAPPRAGHAAHPPGRWRWQRRPCAARTHDRRLALGGWPPRGRRRGASSTSGSGRSRWASSGAAQPSGSTGTARCSSAFTTGRSCAPGPGDRRDWERPVSEQQELAVPTAGAPGAARPLTPERIEVEWVKWNEDQDRAGGHGARARAPVR